MFSTRELEGEVDHTFFDSDCEEKGENADMSSEANTDTMHPSNASSSGFRERTVTSHNVGSDVCDDTVTNVSPLSSPTSSRLQSLDLNHSDTEEDKSVPSSGISNAQHYLNQEEDNYTLNSTSRLDGKMVMQCRSVRFRKNYSFTNSEVQRIDRDNQRLFWRLSHLAAGSRPGSAQVQRPVSSIPVKSSPHSAINRQRKEQRIEQENLAASKRLESVKPSPGMKRSEQLADYQRQAAYPGVCRFYRTTGEKSLGKGSHHSARAASTPRESCSTSAARPRKTKSTRPDWS